MIDKKYNHKEVEIGKYEKWLEKDLFKSGDLTKEPFSIVIPPPNVTGKLHLGHAWDVTIQDIIIRYKRMQGFDAMWLPGMDHAGIATQAKIDEMLRNKGTNPRSITREEWLKHAWKWKEEYAKAIREQWGKLGLSLDYSKERFTMDEGLSNAVKKVFVDYYKKGLIYRGERPINWDPQAGTALSNIEVIYKEEKGTMYYFKYFIEGSDKYIEVATTRPETLGADTALVVNPNDERYKPLVGKNVITPLRKELIPVITDDFIDISFGSGAMKCSAHATEDIRILKENNIKIQECINKDGILNENSLEFKGMTREEGRKAIVEKLKQEGLLIKEEEYLHQVGYSERTNVPIEILIMPQWFVNMAPLAEETLNLQNSDNKVNFIPERFGKTFTNWMENIEDWCISRQLWWGHRIPAWYKGSEIYVGYEAPNEEGWEQDPDVLDTWFSSALWPFSTLGWPEETADVKRYFPNNALVTGYDIIPFWVARMIFQSVELTRQKPFNDCIIHGLIRDKDGQKMSKSLGNGVDPMEVIEKYGADSLRFFLTTNTAAGQDLRYDEEKVKSTWNFINKIWNATRYVTMSDEKETNNKTELNSIDKWILSKLNKVIKSITESMEKYEFNNAGNELYNFIWNDYCDWYIELSKLNNDKSTKETLKNVLLSILKLLHPYMPHVTDEIYKNLTNEEITLSKYPEYQKELSYTAEETEINTLITIVKDIRKQKLENGLSNFTKYENKINMTPYSEDFKSLLTEMIIKTIKPSNEENSDLEVFTFKSIPGEIVAYYKKTNDLEDNKEKTNLQINALEASILRRESLLNNQNYLEKAPKELIEKEKATLNEEKIKLELLKKDLQ